MTINLNRTGWLFSIQKKSGDMQVFVPDISLIGSGILLGRDKSCDLIINDQYISRKHCRIRYYKGNLQINDLGSTNSVFMDGIQVEKGKHYTWLVSSSLRLGIGIEVTSKRINFKELPKGVTLINKRPSKIEVQDTKDGTELVEMVKENYQISNVLPKNEQSFWFKYANKVTIGILGILIVGGIIYVVFLQL